MGKHEAVPSQVANPWRAVWRTVLEVGIPAFGLVLFAGPAVLQILAEELGAVLPAGLIAWLLGAAAALTAAAAALTRIMALPRVNELLSRIKADAGAPKPPVLPRDPDVDVRGTE
ncbi:membrane protein [Arthrobacter phage Kuleana]|uniref:Uncharacterized protein n=1 Tax=Arthrobacter phage Kuleana TaxID=2653270 RepID=A0A5Q2WC06_9CAUD|nr:membrane protein [Arthrobacter phage Kuleana]QGH74511.1 hypothetical protein SEA_KULEANA_24 [Arthrobacter phage Kuleana]